MADFYFFTEPDKLNNQSANEAFGPAGSLSGKDRFRITSLHSSSSSSAAYAICDGTVCVQQDRNNTNLINIVLRPNQQPDINIPYLSFIIYKGVLKSSLFDGAGNVLNDQTNDLTKSIKASWDAYKAIHTGSAALAPEKALGIDLIGSTTNFSDSDPINNLFYQNQSEFQFPNVRGGWKIGSFDATKFGIEIITEKIGFEPTLKLTRQLENYIEVSTLQSGATNADIFKHWHDKEEILNFIDPCAFYGSFYASKIKTKSATGTFDSKQDDEIYDEFLKGVHHTNSSDGNFFNRNKTYLDIRNDYNQSFNYFKEYGTDVYVAFDDNSNLSSFNYYSSNWPIATIENPSFPADITNTSATIRVALPQENNQKPLIFISLGFRNFSINTFRKLKDKKRFIELDYNPTSTYTSEFELSVANKSNQNVTTIISSIILIRYIRQIDFENNNPPDNFLKKSYPLDNIFTPFNMNFYGTNTSDIKFRIFSEEAFVEKKQGSQQYVANISLAEDVHNITLLAFPKYHKRFSGFLQSQKLSIASGSSNESNFFIEYIDKNFFNNNLNTGDLSISSQLIEYQSLQLSSPFPNANLKINRVDQDEIVVLTFDKNEFNSTITALISTNNILTDYKIYIGIKNLSELKDDNDLEYVSFELVIRGLVESTGEINLIEVPTNIKMYSHDTF